MAESRQLFLCSYCEFRCYNNLGLLKHIRATHENDPNFRVYCSLCGKSYNKWCSFKKHLHRDHGMDNEATKSCMYMYPYIGTECANSTSIDYVHDLVIIWMKVTPLKMKSGSVPSFYSMLPKSIILPMMGLPIGSMACRFTIRTSKGKDKCTSI